MKKRYLRDGLTFPPSTVTLQSPDGSRLTSVLSPEKREEVLAKINGPAIKPIQRIHEVEDTWGGSLQIVQGGICSAEYDRVESSARFVRITALAHQCLLSKAFGPLAVNGTELNDGNWEVPLSHDTFVKLIEVSQPNESLSDTIVRIASNPYLPGGDRR